MGKRVQRLSLVVLVTIAVHALGHGDSRDLSLFVRPAFEGMGTSSLGGSAPWIIDVGNRGENTRGEVVIRSDFITIRHPVELPSGSKKRFFSYVPDLSAYSEVTVKMETTVGSVAFPIPTEEMNREHICLIGGNSGDMTFMRVADEQSYSDHIRDVYAKPGSLPDRPIGYSACALVVLGEGAERMSNTEVEALKGWVVAGGTLVFLGGASVPVLHDSRWRDFLPIESVGRANVSTLPGIERLAGSPAPSGTISITYGQAVDGAKAVFSAAGRDLITERRIGMGFVIYVAFDPFQPPLKQWNGLKKLFNNGFQVNRSLENRIWVGSRSGGPQEASYYPMADSINSPFNVKLPSAGIVLLILFAHLLVSVPLNFFIMRRLGKGELAWITTPIICIAFAAVFFQLASGLYEAGQSTRSRGVLVASSLYPMAVFKGKSEVFIPRGGRYDLKLQNIESVSSVGYDYYGRPSFAVAVVDDGTVRIPDMLVPNLAFREYQISEHVPAESLLKLAGTRQGPGLLRLEIENLSEYTLENVEVHYYGKVFLVGSIGPGDRFNSVVTGRSLATDRWSDERVLVLSSVITGFRPGPQIGTDVGSHIELVYVGEAPK